MQKSQVAANAAKKKQVATQPLDCPTVPTCSEADHLPQPTLYEVIHWPVLIFLRYVEKLFSCIGGMVSFFRYFCFLAIFLCNEFLWSHSSCLVLNFYLIVSTSYIQGAHASTLVHRINQVVEELPMREYARYKVQNTKLSAKDFLVWLLYNIPLKLVYL